MWYWAELEEGEGLSFEGDNENPTTSYLFFLVVYDK